MAVITSTPALVRPVLPDTSEFIDSIMGVASAIGQAGYWNTSGNLVLSNAAAAGTAKFGGIILNAVGANQAVSLMKKGYLFGYNVSALAYGAKVFLSDTPGALDTAAGTVSVAVGAVVPLPDAARTKVIYIDANYLTML